MTNDIFKKLEFLAKTNVHNVAWLDRGEARLRAVMAQSPLRHHIRNLADRMNPQGQPIIGMSRAFNWFFKPMTALITIAVLLAGSLSLAANGSMPGDALYGWKTNVNERVESAVTVKSDSQAKLEVERLERRVSERAQVNASTEVNAEAKQEADAAVAAQAQKAEEAVEGSTELSAEEKAELKAEIDVTLDASIELNGNLRIEL